MQIRRTYRFYETSQKEYSFFIKLFILRLPQLVGISSEIRRTYRFYETSQKEYSFFIKLFILRLPQLVGISSEIFNSKQCGRAVVICIVLDTS